MSRLCNGKKVLLADYCEKGLPIRAIKEALDELPDLGILSSDGTVINEKKLFNVSKDVISNMTIQECVQEITSWAKEHDQRLCLAAMADPEKFRESVELWKQTNGKKRKDVTNWAELYDKYDYLYDANWTRDKGWLMEDRYDLAEVKRVLREYLKQFTMPSNREKWLAAMKGIAGSLGYTEDKAAYGADPDRYKGLFSDFCGIIRKAITGRLHSPDLFDIICFLGEDEVRNRLLYQIRLKSFSCDYVDVNVVTKKSVYKFKNSMSQFQIPEGCFVVSTCLRYELYGVNLEQDQLVPRKDMVHLEGKQALSRFLRLLVGEYSELKGEIEIRNQVKRGLRRAYQDGRIGEEAYALMQDIMAFADGLREKYGLTNTENYSTLAHRMLMDKWENDRRKTIMILGDGYMAQAFCAKMRGEETRFVFVNRDVKKAKSIFGTPDHAVHVSYKEMEMFVPLVDAVFIALSNVDQALYPYEKLFQNREVRIIDVSYPAVFLGDHLTDYVTLENFDWTQMCQHRHKNNQLYADIERYVNRKCIE